jgi:putative membrane protein
MTAPQYVAEAGSSDLFEIQSSELALQRSNNPQVRSFAEQMIRDHSGSAAQLKSITTQENVASPALDPRHARMLDQLRGLSGPQFDVAYIQMQVQGHREALAVEDEYRTGGSDPRLRALAEQATPMIEHHLTEAESISSNVAAAPARPESDSPLVRPIR